MIDKRVRERGRKKKKNREEDNKCKREIEKWRKTERKWGES